MDIIRGPCSAREHIIYNKKIYLFGDVHINNKDTNTMDFIKHIGGKDKSIDFYIEVPYGYNGDNLTSEYYMTRMYNNIKTADYSNIKLYSCDIRKIRNAHTYILNILIFLLYHHVY